jgi:CheY-like chemotaxis protein
LIQVVINLISNAVKFTDQGTVICRAGRRGGDVVVSVVDTGLGIAPTDQPKVFERFKQVGDTLTDKPKGTGLGLPICREIVEHHGGHIWVESEIGRGSTFSFTLPVSAETKAGAPAPLELAALIRQLRDQVVVTTPRRADRQPRILVVDDDPNIRELLTQELSEAGYQVRVAGNGREALVHVRGERPDLIVLDVMMPEMNGFDVAAVLKNDPTTMDIPIVILSIVQDRDRGFRLGVDRYLTKPIDTELLFKEVGALIEQKKSHKRVLVVDEDATTVRTLTDVLTARGYSVAEARGDDLLDRAVAVKPDIIMLNSVSSARSDAVQMLRFEKGMENVLFLVYQ